MKFEVTREDIDEGESLSVSNCPIARCFQRHGYNEAVVGGIRVFQAGLRDSPVQLPLAAQRFIINFDSPKTRDKLMPFSFEIEDKDLPKLC